MIDAKGYGAAPYNNAHDHEECGQSCLKVGRPKSQLRNTIESTAQTARSCFKILTPVCDAYNTGRSNKHEIQLYVSRAAGRSVLLW
jgi:hypothetical protein